MSRLAVFRIKNDDFDYEKYGLDDVYFSLDVIKSIQESKGVSTTEYPLLDGTTRIDNISAKAGTLTLQGEIGDIAYSKDRRFEVKGSGNVSKLENTKALLRALRDEAIVLNIITHEETFNNYIITDANFGKTRIGTSDFNITLKEFIMFGDTLDSIEDDRAILEYDPDASYQLRDFTARDFNSDIGLVNEIHRIVTDSSIRTNYIIRLGSLESGSDVLIPPIKYRRGVIRYDNRDDVYNYTAPSVLETYDRKTYVTGRVVNNKYLKIDIDRLEEGVYLSTPFTHSQRGFFYLPQEEAIHNISFDLYERQLGSDKILWSISTKDLIKAPRYSQQVINGINPITDTVYNENDFINDNGSLKGYKASINFLRKCSQDTYRAVPNLLPNSNLGYLYPNIYETVDGSDTYINLGFTYIHPDLLPKLKSELEKKIKQSTFFRNKRFIWW